MKTEYIEYVYFLYQKIKLKSIFAFHLVFRLNFVKFI